MTNLLFLLGPIGSHSDYGLTLITLRLFLQVVSNEARARSQRMTEAAAARIAELEDQVERQQRALR